VGVLGREGFGGVGVGVKPGLRYQSIHDYRPTRDNCECKTKEYSVSTAEKTRCAYALVLDVL
jgi:hypothetical protein